jgi:hypothetical protein
MPHRNALRLIDTGQAPEVFCSALGRVEHIGSMVRYTLYSEIITASGEREGIVNLKVVMPSESVQPAMEITLYSLGTLITGAVRRLVLEKWFH